MRVSWSTSTLKALQNLNFNFYFLKLTRAHIQLSYLCLAVETSHVLLLLDVVSVNEIHVRLVDCRNSEQITMIFIQGWPSFLSPGDHDLGFLLAVAPWAGQKLLQRRPDVRLGGRDARTVRRNSWKSGSECLLNLLWFSIFCTWRCERVVAGWVARCHDFAVARVVIWQRFDFRLGLGVLEGIHGCQSLCRIRKWFGKS